MTPASKQEAETKRRNPNMSEEKKTTETTVEETADEKKTVTETHTPASPEVREKETTVEKKQP